MTFNLPEDMDIPEHRRQLSNENLRWLLRNLAIRNSNHPKFEEVISNLKSIQSIMSQITPRRVP